MFHNEFLGII